ncbi:MAG: disulfide bond formation protein B [Alphaproteobacteria bacterium]
MVSARLPLVVLATGIGTLGGALAFQYIGGLAPCDLCLWQRWPWAIALAVAAGALLLGRARERLHRPIAVVLGLLFVVSLGLGLYHVAVEQHWIAGPTACSAPLTGARSPAELERMILGRPVVRCDEIPWSLGPISLAGFNAIFSALLAIIAFRAATRDPAAA